MRKLTPEIKLHRAVVSADAHQLSAMKGEQQEWSSSLQQEDSEPPHIKEEEEELWSSQEGEQLQGLEEEDTNKLPSTAVPVKSKDEEEEAQSSQLHQRKTERMETGADGEDCGGPGADKTLDPMSEVQIEESNYKDGLQETREPKSSSDSVAKRKLTGPGTNKRIPTAEKPFGCSVCGKEFEQNAQLETHMIIHTGGKPFSCSECGHRYKYQGHLIAHMQTHTGEKPYTCTDCGKGLSTKVSLALHKRSHTGEKPFSCYECHRSFNRKGSLARHMLVHSGEKPFSCPVCCRRFNRKWHLNRHMLVHGAEKPFSCSECSLRFNSESGLMLHMTFHKGEKPYSFIPGEKRAQWRSQLKIVKCVGGQAAELRQNEAEEKRPDEGAETFRNLEPEIYSQAEIEVKLEESSGSETEDSEDDWRETGNYQSCLNSLRHEGVPQSATTFDSDKKQVLYSHSDETFPNNHSLKIHTGSQVGKQLTESDSLSQHMIVREQEDQESQIIKEEQEEVWIDQTDTNDPVPVKSEDEEEDCEGPEPHMNSDPGCSEQEIKDVIESDINSEENPLTEEMSHSCSECGKTFKQKQSLSVHMMVHTGEKPFCCSECGKRFNRKSSLTRHMLLYRGEKPFSCSVCSKTFSRKWHLTRHVLLHKAEKPFNCSVCSVQFNKESGLTLHMAFHRGEKPDSCSV
ncbi:uncharacterized protein LOC141802827 [Halichoeres trimaculatus]|uniref:uncharacterized protein LOC141802827 n=1 Tax=Halichoeres trimaculatus TaxID=147232 RepID=UPI003D9DFB93